MNEVTQSMDLGFTPLRSALRTIRSVLGMGTNIILTGSLKAPRLYPAGALLWVLPPRHKAIRRGEGQTVGDNELRHELRYVGPEAFEKLYVNKQALVSEEEWAMCASVPRCLALSLSTTAA